MIEDHSQDIGGPLGADILLVRFLLDMVARIPQSVCNNQGFKMRPICSGIAAEEKHGVGQTLFTYFAGISLIRQLSR